MVTSTGNQGNSPIHVMGSFSQGENEKEIQLIADEQQQDVNLFLYFLTPDKISIGITAPSGESIEKIEINPANGEQVIINLGESTITIQYFTEEKGGSEVKLDQRIDFFIGNISTGVWKIKLIGDYLLSRTYDLWLEQKEFLRGVTGFVDATPNTTLMTPSTANNIIVCSSYDQINKQILLESGRGFTRDGRILPTVALPSKNILTVGINKETTIVSGAAVSGAILAGIVSLLFQWGIVLQNDVNMYASKIKSYLILAATKSIEENYPNPETGFGVLSIENLVNLLNRETNENREIIDNGDTSSYKNTCGLFINIPQEIYKRLKI